jgi:hypothetical protein
MDTTLDSVALADLGELLAPHLRYRRLFVSACGMTNHRLARAWWPKSSCFSVLGPDRNIGFADAAILWAALYHVLFAEDRVTVDRSTLQAKAQEMANLFRVPLRCFLSSGTERRGYKHVRLVPRPDSADRMHPAALGEF